MPSSEGHWWRPPKLCRPENISFTLADGAKIHAWWFPCPKSDGATIYCHGNNKNLSLFRTCRAEHVARWHKKIGVSLLIFDYPGYGRSGGTPSEQGCYDAADAAYEWLTSQQGIPGNKIILVGQSLGSAVAVDLAAKRDHRALVLISSFTSIPDVAEALCPLLPANLLMHNRFNNLAKIRQCTRPLLIFHGTADLLTPLRQGRLLYRTAGACCKRMVEVPNAPHHISTGGCFFLELKRFLDDFGC